MNKEKPKITLITMTCGNYSLDVDGKGYLYYSVAELVEGFLYHVGLSNENYADKQVIADLIEACATYPKEGQAIEAAAKMKSQVETLEQRLTRQQTEYKSLQEYCDKLRKKVDDQKAQIEYLAKHGGGSYIGRKDIPKKK
jgi:polyhydroxyalkanoate synthesis regulator phasin